ncbi:MAG: sulfurtransferase TusA family protein [Thermoprotei archaeon]
MEAVKVLDLTKSPCPEPFMTTVKELARMKEGTIRVMFTEPQCLYMIIHAARMMKCKILENKNENGVFVLTIQKQG